ncbi:hypothetical protein HanPI659440_Chr02g0044761 [Helianthus annuus]|nr:hypothetical protein HanPI659440_Chr02g0044761 [Helianthus annuus]
MNKSDTRVLEALNKRTLHRICYRGFSNKSEGWVAGFCTSFDYKFSDVPGSTDDQNLALLGCHLFFRRK